MTDVNRTWQTLEGGLEQIYDHTSKVLVQRYMGLYTEVFNFCTRHSYDENEVSNRSQVSREQKGADFIGAELYEKLRVFVTAHVKEQLKVLDGLHGEDLLTKYTELWTRFQFSSTVVNGIFSYLNRHWIKREMDEGKNSVVEVYNLTVLMWQQHLFEPLKRNLTPALINLIKQERDGEKITTQLVSGVISSYLELGVNEPQDFAVNNLNVNQKNKEYKLGVYRREFEAPFIEHTRAYYSAESAEFVQNNSITEYLKKVETRLNEEKDRCVLYLHELSLEPLLKTCHLVLIKNHLPAFNVEFEQLLNNDKDDDMARMFALCEHVECALDDLRKLLEKHVERVGRETIAQCASTAIQDPKAYVNVILGVHKKYDDLVTKSFRSDTGFVQSMDKAFTSFINKNKITELAKTPAKSPELLAKCCDMLLRKSAKNPEDRELEEFLTQVMVVFKYIDDKDVFQKFYSKFLAKRLVNEMSSSEEAESSMITKLKQMCGFEYTSKLQRMFTDATLSKEISDEFKKHIQDSGTKTVDMGIMILASGVWPFSKPAIFDLPPSLNDSIDKLTKFYTLRHNGRRLTFLLQMCRGEVMSYSLPKRYSFITSAAQISILMQFNNKLSFTIHELAENLKMQKDILVPSVQSCVKGELFKVNGDIEQDTTTVTLNEQFSNRKMKVDLSKTVMKADTKKESDEVQQSVEEDRKMVVQACIVRIMKTRKALKHNLLISEVLGQLSSRFTPKIPMIKKCIDMLIEKEYLKRADAEMDTYEYLA
ncbi:unnamed protein product [Bursaphelenchus xylophilus]|uniref:(pine wood nematode) hypothetical protein n=1 Tax=Bursaphelenchus xylophilus TaxID=6326 RepID=A0A1I7RRH3_BURXY|nr:unnamed protein product [Bursaphelenchus xylophilus]CAG9131038.1 unnamed protein product [Bursaphelenchus xylophilus]